MAPDYGRWPWPRDVLATVLAELEAQGAKAVVFDILFADADRQNPVSERAFDEAVAASRIAYFPVLRLDPANDAKSAVRAGDLAGLVVRPRMRQAPVARQCDPPSRSCLPYLDAVVKGGHLGTHNVDPDPDGTDPPLSRWRGRSATTACCRCPRVSRSTSAGRFRTRPTMTLRFNDRAMAYRTCQLFGRVHRLAEQASARDRPTSSAARIVVIGATAAGPVRPEGHADLAHPSGHRPARHRHRRHQERALLPRAPAVGRTSRSRSALLVLMPWLCIRYSHEQLRLRVRDRAGDCCSASRTSASTCRRSSWTSRRRPRSRSSTSRSPSSTARRSARRWGEGELFAPLLDPAMRPLGRLPATVVAACGPARRRLRDALPEPAAHGRAARAHHVGPRSAELARQRLRRRARRDVGRARRTTRRAIARASRRSAGAARRPAPTGGAGAPWCRRASPRRS